MIGETVVLPQWRLHILLLIQSLIVQCLSSRPVTLRSAYFLVIRGAGVGTVSAVANHLVVFVGLENGGQPGVCGYSGDEGHLVRIKL